MLTKESVSIYQSNGNKLVGTATTDGKGTYSVSVTPSGTTSYYARFAGDGTYLGAQSGTVTVTVTKK